VGTMLSGLKKFKDYRMLVLPDHPTPISIRTHSDDPVPCVLYSSSKDYGGCSAYSEKMISRSKMRFNNGPALIDFFFKKA